VTAPGPDPIQDLYVQLVQVYSSYENAALDGACWIVGPDDWLLMRRSFARNLGDPRADDDPPPEEWKPEPGDRVLALPVEVREDAGAIRLVPGPNAR